MWPPLTFEEKQETEFRKFGVLLKFGTFYVLGLVMTFKSLLWNLRGNLSRDHPSLITILIRTLTILVLNVTVWVLIVLRAGGRRTSNGWRRRLAAVRGRARGTLADGGGFFARSVWDGRRRGLRADAERGSADVERRERTNERVVTVRGRDERGRDPEGGRGGARFERSSPYDVGGPAGTLRFNLVSVQPCSPIVGRRLCRPSACWLTRDRHG